MRVVQVSWHLDPQRRRPAALLAAWSTLVEAAAAARADDVDVTVVQAAHDDEVIEARGVRFEFVRVPAGSRLRARAGAWAAPISSRMLDRIAVLQPDVLHQHGLTHPLHARALNRRLPRTPLLVQDHASRPPRRLRRLHARGFRDVTAAAFTARAQAAPFLEAGVLPRRVRVFELLEGSTRFVPRDQTAARARTGLTGTPCIVWLGRLDANKDPLTVLRAFADVRTSLPDARLFMAFGAAPLRAEVERFIAEHRLGDRVTLLGGVPHPRVEWLLSAADVLVQGSHFEGSGYAVIEALACGATPVVTDIPPFRRITRDGAVGTLVPTGDAGAFARAILELSQRDRSALRASARAHFERCLSFDVIGRELREAYAALGGRAA